jgi:hypothetical protein
MAEEKQTDAIAAGIRRWVNTERGKQTGAENWIEALSKADWDNPTRDDFDNLHFITRFLYDEMGAWHWLTSGLRNSHGYPSATILFEQWEIAVDTMIGQW